MSIQEQTIDAISHSDINEIINILITKPKYPDLGLIIRNLIDSNNVLMLNIFILYGLDFNYVVNAMDAECDVAYIDYIDSPYEYQEYDDNKVFKIINSNLRWYYDTLDPWYIEPINFVLTNELDCTFIMKIF